MDGDSITCASCGERVPVGKRFCGICGSPLALTCTSCGASNRPGVRFCEDCGQPLEVAPASPMPMQPPPSVSVPAQAAPAAAAEPRAQEERRLVTALFCDLVGFTPLSESLDPEEVRDLQAAYFEAMAAQIERYGGIVEKYAGDAVLALFGARMAREDDAERAVLCALGMQGAIEPVVERARQRWSVEPAIRIGVNTGDVVSGTWDASGRQDVAVTGDAVNTAARIQATAEPGEVLAGAETMRLTRRRIRYGERRDVSLKGKAGTVPVWPALGVREGIGERWEEHDSVAPLIGRDREMAQLLEAWGRAQAGEGQLLSLVGEPGVGKSRLAAELVDRLSAESALRIVRARCLSYGQEISLWLLTDLLRSLFGILEQDALDEVAVKLRAAIPSLLGDTDAGTRLEALDVLGEVLGLPPAESPVSKAGPEVRRRALNRSLRAVLGAISERAPAVLILEDLHWMDAASQEVLREVLADVAGMRMLVVAAQRPGWAAPWSEWGWAERITLRPLREGEAAMLAGAVLGGVTLSTELEQYVADRAGGNPFFVEELLRALQETGGTDEHEGMVRLVPSAAERLPSTLTEVLLARLDRLDAPVKHVAQVGSVIGRSFAVKLLAEVVGREQTALETPLAQLQRAEIAFPRRNPDLEYVFKHVSMRDVAYNTLVQRRRQELHLHTARAIAALYPSDEYVEIIAYHYSKTEAPEAAEWLERAGERAAKVYANEAAIGYFEDARRRLEAAGAEATVLARLDERLGGVLSTVGRYDEAIAPLERAVAAHREARDLESAARVTAALGRIHRERGTAEEGIARVEPMIELLSWSGPSPALASLYIALSHLYFFVGRHRELLEVAERGSEIARAVGNERLLGEAEMRRGTALTTLGQAEAGRLVLEEALTAVEQGGDLIVLFQTLNNLGVAAERLGEIERMAAYGDQTLAVTERIGNPAYTCFALSNVASGLILTGEWERARSVLGRAVALARTMGNLPDSAYPLLQLGQLSLWQGDWETARRHLDDALEVAEGVGDRQTQEQVQIYLAELDVLAGRPEEAAARLEPWSQMEGGEHAQILVRLAWTYMSIGDAEHVDRAEQVAAAALSETDQQPGYRVYSLWVQGMLLARQKRFDEAAAVLGQGLELARSMPYPYMEARILREMSELPDAGPSALQDALAIFRRLGALWDVAQIEGVLSAG